MTIQAGSPDKTRMSMLGSPTGPRSPTQKAPFGTTVARFGKTAEEKLIEARVEI